MPTLTHSFESGARSLRRRFLLLTALVVVAFARPALADDTSSAEADALFRNGLDEMRAGRYAVACPMLAKSYQLDPLPGALFTLADCEAAWGKAATAIELYQSFVNGLTVLPADRRVKFDERRRLALEKIGALGPLAAELTIDVSLAPPPNLVIKRNGTPIDRAAYGVSKRVDPGEYALVAEIDGKVAWERHVTLAPGDKARVDVPWLESSKPRPIVTVIPAELTVTTAPRPTSSASTTRTLAYFAGGIGVGGLVAGAVTGFLALHDKGVVDDNCPMRRCNAAGRDALESARASATVSTIGFSVGLAGTVGAVVLWVASSDKPKSSSDAKVTVRPLFFAGDRGATVGLAGAFR
jgi:hypothetical protein